MESLNKVIFYDIDKAIRTYRQYAQRQIKASGLSITIDQWLILESIQENPDITQQDLAEKVFKDNASVTRIIELLVKVGYLKRLAHGHDRRRTTLEITNEGKKIIDAVSKVVKQNRDTALKGIGSKEIDDVKRVLRAIIQNCC